MTDTAIQLGGVSALSNASPVPGTEQLAQVGSEPIGQVTELIGSASVARGGASAVALMLNDPIHQDDLVATETDASLTIRFVDGTIFSLGGNAQLVLDRIIFDPSGSDNEMLLSVLQGSFSFITGEVNKGAGPGMTVDTPVGTIGVRGTAVVGDFDLVRLLVTLLQGQIVFSNNVAQALLATAFDTINVGSANQTDLTVYAMTDDEQAVYDLLLPKILQQVTPEAGQEQDSGGNGEGGGIRIIPAEPGSEGEDGEADDLGPRGDVPPSLLDQLQAIADDIVQELTEENPNLILLATGSENDGTVPDTDGPPTELDGSFETGFSGWTTSGDATIETADFGSGPTEGLNQALITTGPGALSAATIEGLLGLELGALTATGNGVATEGSAITAMIPLNAGDVLSFDFNFLTDEIPAPDEVNDFAFVAINGLTELADTFNLLVPSDTRFVDETGFVGSFSFTAPEDGDYQLGIGVVDVDDTVFDSGLLIDNVTITPAAGAVVEA